MGNSQASRPFGWVRDSESEIGNHKFIKVKVPKYLPEKINELRESFPEIENGNHSSSSLSAVKSVMEFLGLPFTNDDEPDDELTIRECLEQQSKIKFRRVKQDLNILKTLIFKGHPIIFGMNFYEPNSNWDPASKPYTKTSDNLIGGLTGVIVAYSDSRNCFLVRNCWGKQWGMEGHFMVPYEYVLDSEQCGDFWIVDVKIPRETVEIPREEVEMLSRRYEEIKNEIEQEPIEEQNEEFEQEITEQETVQERPKSKSKQEPKEECIIVKIHKPENKTIPSTATSKNCLIVDES